MTVHIAKVCVGADAIGDLSAWQQHLMESAAARGVKRGPWHTTRMFPRRADEVLDGGSLYWTISGFFAVRQRIIGLEEVRGSDGIKRCQIDLDPELVPVSAWARRPFQGWRYLPADEAPPDLAASDTLDGPTSAELERQLAELGLL